MDKHKRVHCAEVSFDTSNCKHMTGFKTYIDTLQFFRFVCKSTLIKTRKFQLSSICRQLKLRAKDGIFYNTDVIEENGLNTVLAIIPNKRTEVFAKWMKNMEICNDIVSGKAKLEKCSEETVYKIAKTMEVSMETILAPGFVKRSSFENFKSTICHRVKELGDIEFIIETLESHDIRMYFERKWYPESLYLLAMLDYISRVNNVPLCEDYNDLRRCRLEKTIYPSSVLAMAAASKKEDEIRHAELTAIPEFKQFSIIEGEVRNVI